MTADAAVWRYLRAAWLAARSPRGRWCCGRCGVCVTAEQVAELAAVVGCGQRVCAVAARFEHDAAGPARRLVGPGSAWSAVSLIRPQFAGSKVCAAGCVDLHRVSGLRQRCPTTRYDRRRGGLLLEPAEVVRYVLAADVDEGTLG